ncbi:MAG TPA: S26 family signal peptidase [Candidatus Thermoplasmatota archaeon]|nr:S26 family signal peptidase [Candidatus Thermoplasmatota archaeon]
MALSPGVRDALALVLTFIVVLGGLYLYTGTWPPAVIVESGSMMHADSDVQYGRVRTIDPGDLVLVKEVGSVDEVETLVEGGRSRYGKPGDVIVFYPRDDRSRTPIIHRAVAYVEVRGGGYDVRWSADAPCEGGATKLQRDGRAWCRYGAAGILIPSVPVQGEGSTPAQPRPYRPSASGFITKGDNPVTNRHIDQTTLPQVDRPVPHAWIEGKGRGELPWLGLIKLALAGKPNEDSPPPAWVKIGSAYAPKDLWVMLAITLAVLIGGPLLYDGTKAMRARRKERERS